MRRADRLFQIIQLLRASPRPVTAAVLARELEVSVRSVYRDVADLVGRRVPITGEAGRGYVLEDDYHMPPLMLDEAEAEAAVLGAQWVAEHADPALRRAALGLHAKLAAVVPARLRQLILEPSTGIPPAAAPASGLDIGKTRIWIRQGRKMRIDYRDAETRPTRRVIWPVVVGYTEKVQLLAAWCELRWEFRHFRADRVAAAEFLEEGCGVKPAILKASWQRSLTTTRLP